MNDFLPSDWQVPDKPKTIAEIMLHNRSVLFEAACMFAADPKNEAHKDELNAQIDVLAARDWGGGAGGIN